MLFFPLVTPNLPRFAAASVHFALTAFCLSHLAQKVLGKVKTMGVS